MSNNQYAEETSSEDSASAFYHKKEIPTFERTRRGKIKDAQKKSSIYTKSSYDSLSFPEFSQSLITALESQFNVLEKRKRRKNQEIDGLDVSINKLKETLEILLANADNPLELERQLDPYQIWGGDQKGHVKFTGYFAPVLNYH